jgi:histidinol-phosphatase (PHP family)
LHDFHIHSCFSYDGQLTLSSIVHEAETKNLKGICFTDHYEMFHIRPQWVQSLDTLAYRQAVENMRQQSSIPVFMGVEIGMQPGFAQQASRYVVESAFDFVIASIHIFRGHDPYYEDLSLLMEPDSIIDLMVDETIESLKDFNSFSVLGHLDYIFKHHPMPFHTLTHADSPEKLDALLKLLIHKGKGIEVNTSGYSCTGSSMPGAGIVKRYHELGGEIVTIGSDTHDAGQIGRNFRSTLDMLIQSGFRFYTYFQQMKPFFVPIT